MMMSLKELETGDVDLKVFMQSQLFSSLLRPKVGWFANKSLQATRDGVSSSASRFTLVGPACLSSGR
jgi:hypothetical protein